MAFVVKDIRDRIEVIAWQDRSVKCNGERYKAYLDSFKGGSPDESLLNLDGEPTRFVLRTTNSWQQEHKLRNANIKVVGNKAEVKANFAIEKIRMHLVDIKNPPGEQGILPFKRDDDGGANRELLQVLERHGVLGDLQTALNNVTRPPEKEAEAKNA